MGYYEGDHREEIIRAGLEDGQHEVPLVTGYAVTHQLSTTVDIMLYIIFHI
jgi:hypothetical protein